MILYRIFGEANNLYIEYFKTPNVSGNFSIKKPERIDFKKLTKNEWIKMSQEGLIPDSLEAYKNIGKLNHIILAENYGDGFVTSYVKEKGGKWIGHTPFRSSKLLKLVIDLLFMLLGVLISVKIMELFGL